MVPLAPFVLHAKGCSAQFTRSLLVNKLCDMVTGDPAAFMIDVEGPDDRDTGGKYLANVKIEILQTPLCKLLLKKMQQGGPDLDD